MDYELNFCYKNRLFGSFMSSSSFKTFVILTKNIMNFHFLHFFQDTKEFFFARKTI